MLEIDPGSSVPAIIPSITACVLCDDLPCVTACPDGALQPPAGGPEQVRIGIAKVDPRRCVTFLGQRCDRCYQVCPLPDRAIMMIGARPIVGSGACTGCGLCEQACPEEPKAITVIAERELIPGMRVPKTEYNVG
jgi:ferredoxin-type protein NapG